MVNLMNNRLLILFGNLAASLWVFAAESSGSLELKQLKSAAEQGDTQAQLALSMKYFTGDGVDVDYRQSVSWARKAAEQGHAEAQYMVGEAYLYGKGVRRDPEQGAQWMEKSARQGHPQPQFVVGTLYADGIGVPQNDQTAAKWYRRSADQDYPRATYILGLLYQFGKGVPKDPVQGLKLIKKAAKTDPDAQHYLGLQDLVAGKQQQAAKWFAQAAKQNHAASLFELGILQLLGKGIPANREKAIDQIQQAAKLGHPEARTFLSIARDAENDRAMQYLKAIERELENIRRTYGSD